MNVYLIIIIFLPLTALSQTKTQLERLNFYPAADAYLNLGFDAKNTRIETPEASVNTKNVNNFSNLAHIEYAQKIHKRIFLGIQGFFEETSENVASYGIPLKRRFSNVGFREPKIYILTRIRDQDDNRGLIDLLISYSDTWGPRNIGDNKKQNFTGRNILNGTLSHGLWEEEWEFRTSLSFTYNDEGEEHNKFNNQTYDIESHMDYEFLFSAQYRHTPRLHSYGAIGVSYNGTEVVQDRLGEERELQAGTGSIFKLGLKKSLNDWSMFGVHASYWKDQYFVKGNTTNLDGKRQIFQVGVNLMQAF